MSDITLSGGAIGLITLLLGALSTTIGILFRALMTQQAAQTKAQMTAQTDAIAGAQAELERERARTDEYKKRSEEWQTKAFEQVAQVQAITQALGAATLQLAELQAKRPPPRRAA